MIKSLNIRVYKDEDRSNFQFYDGGVADLYLKNLNKIDTGVIKYINIYFTKKDNLKIIEEGSFLDINVYFDFEHFEKLSDNYQKKKYILDSLQIALLNLCDKFEWECLEFINSASKCISQQLNYEWIFKNKLFQSPDKCYYFGLYCKIDISSFEIYEIVYNSKKNEIARRLCFKDKVPVFLIENAYWGENSLFFQYKFIGPSKIFTARVEDIINHVQCDLTEPTSLFFKG
ncbi:hypothetical protein ACLH3T_001569 [Flavobacterium psychrophilum]